MVCWPQTDFLNSVLKTEQRAEETSPPQEEPIIVPVMLYPSPAERFRPLLADALNRTGVHGVLATINRSRDLRDGHLFLELQIGRLDGATTRKIQQLIAESRKESSDAALL